MYTSHWKSHLCDNFSAPRTVSTKNEHDSFLLLVFKSEHGECINCYYYYQIHYFQWDLSVEVISFNKRKQITARKFSISDYIMKYVFDNIIFPYMHENALNILPSNDP